MIVTCVAEVFMFCEHKVVLLENYVGNFKNEKFSNNSLTIFTVHTYTFDLLVLGSVNA